MPQPLPKALFATCDVVPSPTRHAAISQIALRALTQHFQVDAITIKASHLSHHEKTDRLRIFRIPASKGDYISQLESFRRALIRQLEGEEYQIVHVRSLLVGAAVAKRKAEFGAKLLVDVAHIDSIEAPILYPQLGGNRQAVDKMLADEDLCLKEADAIVTPNRGMRDLLVERSKRTRSIHWVPEGVNIDDFDWLNTRAQQTPVVLYSGSLTPWQGLVTLIEAMEILLRNTAARLIIVHPGNDEHWQTPLKNLANNLGIQQKVEFRCAQHEEVPEILCQADVCVAPYAKVGRNLTQGHFPLKVIEYMACKRPIVASKLPMIEEVLTDNSDALLFTPGNAEDLSKKLHALLSDRALAQKLSEAAYRKAREQFNASKMRRSYSAIYRTLWEEAKEDFPRSGLDVAPERDEESIHSAGTDAGQSSASKKKPARTEEKPLPNGFQDNEATAIFQMEHFEEEAAARASSPITKPSTSAAPIISMDDDTHQKLEAIIPSDKPKPKIEGLQKLLSGAQMTIQAKPRELSAPLTKSKEEPKVEVAPTKPKDTPSRLEVAQAKERADGAAALLARLRDKNKDGA